MNIFNAVERNKDDDSRLISTEIVSWSTQIWTKMTEQIDIFCSIPNVAIDPGSKTDNYKSNVYLEMVIENDLTGINYGRIKLSL